MPNITRKAQIYFWILRLMCIPRDGECYRYLIRKMIKILNDQDKKISDALRKLRTELLERYFATGRNFYK